MNKEEKEKEYILRLYPSFDDLLRATSAMNLISLVNNKLSLYMQPCPKVEDLNVIYRIGNATERFAKRCIVYIYTIKENNNPVDNILNIMASNFLATCSRKTVNEVLCFLCEYPSIKQFGKGFDYTHFSSEFKAYCDCWYVEKNKVIEAQLKDGEEQRNRVSGVTGIEALILYIHELIEKKVDIRQGGLYSKEYGFSALVDKIAPTEYETDDNATEKFYGFMNLENEIYERRRKLPQELLTEEEREMYEQEDNEPF